MIIYKNPQLTGEMMKSKKLNIKYINSEIEKNTKNFVENCENNYKNQIFEANYSKNWGLLNNKLKIGKKFFIFGQIYKRKRKASESNEDNYIIVTFSQYQAYRANEFTT